MIIKVEHEVPFDKGKEGKCTYSGDYWGSPVCSYLKLRDRTHGHKAPVERKQPRCTLFNEWVDGFNKCDKCMQKCKENGGAG